MIDNRPAKDMTLVMITGLLCSPSRRLLRILPKPFKGNSSLAAAFANVPADGQVRSIGVFWGSSLWASGHLTYDPHLG